MDVLEVASTILSVSPLAPWKIIAAVMPPPLLEMNLRAVTALVVMIGMVTVATTVQRISTLGRTVVHARGGMSYFQLAGPVAHQMIVGIIHWE